MLNPRSLPYLVGMAVVVAVGSTVAYCGRAREVDLVDEDGEDPNALGDVDFEEHELLEMNMPVGQPGGNAYTLARLAAWRQVVRRLP